MSRLSDQILYQLAGISKLFDLSRVLKIPNFQLLLFSVSPCLRGEN